MIINIILVIVRPNNQECHQRDYRKRIVEPLGSNRKLPSPSNLLDIPDVGTPPKDEDNVQCIRGQDRVLVVRSRIDTPFHLRQYLFLNQQSCNMTQDIWSCLC
mmetsp:Transcript_22533/g.46391  ORF Transcript_22533/g.46391 Transcript_22533/m.46391 type:complete len:103 (-) Transcript_22533:450-758(-)